jgi:hypothetical protein
MKLHLFFILMDTLILLSYPVLYVVSKFRNIWKVRRQNR